ncbi:MAG: hypothetical protein H6983_09725 [Ectothiorhodospiraceae bacterium]|nr:hypothetical protein [Chromatiales bacterium]MCP5154432.1 hypothetical protein [Ectothiorhodospiraceae bacterium]
MHTLLFLEPGHFHAALTLREAGPCVDETVHLYATPGPERDAFVALVEAFARRDESPARWRVVVHESDDPLAALIAERRGDVVVLAGRNAAKLETIARLHASGFNVLADKPWLLGLDALEHLDAVTAGPPLAMDIMTERFFALAAVRQRLIGVDAVFGTFALDDPARPAIEMSLVHHLWKRVNGVPLRRPPWYYDVAVQGDGMVDIQSHLVDQAQWMVLGDEAPDFARDVVIDVARRWSTPVPEALFRESTGRDSFPAAVLGRVRDGTLELPCNGEIAYRLRGVTVRQRAEWRQREPQGSGDQLATVVRGTRAELGLRLDAETGFRPRLTVRPRPGAAIGPALAEACAAWAADDLPGLECVADDEGWRVSVPTALDGGHESRFVRVRDQFLALVDGAGYSPALAARIRMRYTLLGHARERALEAEGAGRS